MGREDATVRGERGSRTDRAEVRTGGVDYAIRRNARPVRGQRCRRKGKKTRREDPLACSPRGLRAQLSLVTLIETS